MAASSTTTSANPLLQPSRSAQTPASSSQSASSASSSSPKSQSASTSTAQKDSNHAPETGVASADERWIPTEANRHGRWNSHHRTRSLQTLPRSDTVRRALYGHPEIVALTKGLRPKAVASGKLRRVVPGD